MTKLKNTKKGMAKKALSISLVAAMLATSNVPVWAAEDLFSDNGDAAVEYQEPEATDDFGTEDAVFNDAVPAVDDAAVEETDAGIELQAATGSYYPSNVNHSTSIDWAGNVLDDTDTTKKFDQDNKIFTTDSKIVDNSTGQKVADGVLSYVWRIDGNWVGTETFLSGELTDIALPKMTANDEGKTLDLYFFETNDKTDEEKVLTMDFGIIQKVDVKGANVSFANLYPTFQGKDITQKPKSVSLKTVTGLTLTPDDFDWSYSGTNGLQHAGSTVTATGTVTPAAAEEKGITGTVTGSYTISKVTLTAADVTIKVKDTTKAYTYTGEAIDIPAEDVSITYNDTTYDLTPYLDTLKTENATVGTKAIVATFDNTKLKAGDFNSSSTAVSKKTDKADGKVIITALDLANCTAEMLKSYTSAPKTLSYGTDVILKKDGTALPSAIKDSVAIRYAVTDPQTAYAKPDTYQGAIVITGKNANVTGTAYADLVVTEYDYSAAGFKGGNISLIAADDPSDSSIKQKMKYTGSAPTYGAKNTQLGSFYANATATVPIDPSNYEVSFSNVESVSTDKHLAQVTVTGKAGTQYAGLKKTLYFKIVPADVKAVAPAADGKENVANSITTKIPANGTGVEQNDSYTEASQYKDAIGLAITAKADKDLTSTVTPTPLVSVPLTEGEDYTVTSYKFTSDTNGTDWDADTSKEKYVEIKADITSTNVAATTTASSVDYKNNVFVKLKARQAATATAAAVPAKLTMYVQVTAKSIANAEVKLDKEEFTYTGSKIEPAVTVTFGGKILEKDKDYTVSTLNALDAGTAKVVVNGKGEFGGKVEKAFTINKADVASLKLALKSETEIRYDGTKKTLNLGSDAELKLGENTVSSQFAVAEITYGKNINAGKEAGSVTVTASKTNKNFTGTATLTFEILPSPLTVSENNKLTALNIYNANGKKLTNSALGFLTWTGSPVEFYKAQADLTKISRSVATSAPALKTTDVEIVYVNNTDATKDAYIALVGKGNYTGDMSIVKNSLGVISVEATSKVEADNKTTPGTYEILQSGIIKNAAYKFEVKGQIFGAKDITVKDGAYAGGIQVLPEVTIVRDGKTLVQGTDYTIVITDANVDTANATTTPIKFSIQGQGQYKGVTVFKDVNGKDLSYIINKKDLKDAFVAVSDKDGVLTATVMNGNIVETKETFEIKDNGDKTATVSAPENSKNYTGSATVTINAEGDVGQAMIKEVVVKNNKATIILSGDVDNAKGYDYVVSTVEDYKNGRVAFDKNQVATQSTIQYLQKGQYFAYLHAWKRVDGKKVFGGWSNIVPFTVTTTTPDQPLVTSVTRSGSTVKVTYTKTKNATGYDIVLGSKVKKVNGEMRPVEYGKLVKKVYNGNTVTATFKNVPKGTYYAGLHAYNRSSVNNSKVFSPWSNSKKVVVK